MYMKVYGIYYIVYVYNSIVFVCVGIIVYLIIVFDFVYVCLNIYLSNMIGWVSVEYGRGE